MGTSISVIDKLSQYSENLANAVLSDPIYRSLTYCSWSANTSNNLLLILYLLTDVHSDDKVLLLQESSIFFLLPEQRLFRHTSLFQSLAQVNFALLVTVQISSVYQWATICLKLALRLSSARERVTSHAHNFLIFLLLSPRFYRDTVNSCDCPFIKFDNPIFAFSIIKPIMPSHGSNTRTSHLRRLSPIPFLPSQMSSLQ